VLKSFYRRYLAPIRSGRRSFGLAGSACLLLYGLCFAGHGGANALLPITEEVDSSVHQASGIAFPLVLGGLTRTSASDYETQSPGMGFGYKYQGLGPTQGVQAIIYVYNLRVKDVPTSLQSPMLAQVRQLTRREIAQEAEMQSLIARPLFGNTLRIDSDLGPLEALFDGFALDTPVPADTAAQRLPGYHFAALWTVKNHFIKLKVMRSTQSAATPEMMGAFVKAVLAQTHSRFGLPQR
jgi:hypothetical protein